jgi:hypothetical protein
VIAHRDQFRIGEVAVAVLALFFLDLSWLAILLLALVIGALELFFALAKPHDDDGSPDDHVARARAGDR